jgi:methenyltetrahydromethanopterin cyclohydrolase
MHLNQRARAIVEPLVQTPARFAAAVHRIGGTWVVDCGVHAAGGIEAGLVMARAALAGLGEVALHPAGAAVAAWPECRWPTVAVSSREPIAACLAAQYAGWKVKAPGYFAMASGPIRAAIGREELFETIGHRERPEVAVGLLEAAALPPEEVCRKLAADAGVPPEAVVLLVARTASPAGTLQVIARSLETALHKLHDLGFDLGRIRAGRGLAPLAPVPDDDLVAIGRTNDAILYGGHVALDVDGDAASLAAVGPRMVSGASPVAGEPFLRLFEKAGHDFYALDPALFAPASVELIEAETGRGHRFGRIMPEIVAASFAPSAAGPVET